MPKQRQPTLTTAFLAKEPWERRDGESEQAFRAFNIYLDLPMGERTLKAVQAKLQKSISLLMRWKTKWDWRSRCQAYDAAQLEKTREEAEKERLRIYTDGLRFARYFYQNVGTDLQHQFEGWSPAEPTQGDPSGEQSPTPYKKKNDFTVNEKIRLMTWGFNMAERYASARRELMLAQGTGELEASAFDQAFDHLLETSPAFHYTYLQLIQQALDVSRSLCEGSDSS
jgi:hypothetical protein